MDLKYRITFYTNWHCSSGLTSGMDCDTIVAKDKDGLPFVPGKTIKGLLREASNEVIKFKLKDLDSTALDRIFGKPADTTDNMGEAFFSNAELPESEKNVLRKSLLKNYLFASHAFTKIDKDGIAEDNTLRKMQSVVPCVLEGEILNISDSSRPLIEDALRYTKRLGLDRNRGFGRCDFQLIN